MQHHRNLTALAALTTLVLAGATSSASAQMTFTSGNTVSERVIYRDLNINDDAGAKALLGRVQHAARDVCGPRDSDDMLDGGRDYYRCVDGAVKRALAQVNNPVVDALANPTHTKSRTKLAAIGR